MKTKTQTLWFSELIFLGSMLIPRGQYWDLGHEAKHMANMPTLPR